MERIAPKRKNFLFEEMKKELEGSGLVEVVASQSFHRGVDSGNCEGVICIRYKEEYGLADVKGFLGRVTNLEEESVRELIYKDSPVGKNCCGYDRVFVREVLSR
jgi:hypothetical protein